MEEKLLQHQVKLLFGEFLIDRGERDGVEGEVPGRILRDTSTLSGIEIMWSLTMWNHSLLRGAGALASMDHPHAR